MSSSETAPNTSAGGFSTVLRILGWLTMVVGFVVGGMNSQGSQPENLTAFWIFFGPSIALGVLWISLGRILRHLKTISDSLRE
jgi:hypothetical protein